MMDHWPHRTIWVALIVTLSVFHKIDLPEWWDSDHQIPP